MYIVLYGMRILGIFPNYMDAVNYKHETASYDNRYPKWEAFDVLLINAIPKLEYIEDLEKLYKEKVA